ncbi:N-lysine methyltransferase SMYD2-A [Collichthys lucidus]|uniref:[histone H3]-lysine(4) N-trimethyltransferase n=1 Tax=Collichthys lucidus TaxID=240159 RepID=A0A4U5U6Q4_COLLU|nr:N-lysine methyltransferase SMYD2-A [Collichthys lucidus]TKS69970.1 N-lysine methyltransferase SMYD2-A [Collichthys lucidus]
MKNEGIEGTERFLSPERGRGLRAVRHFAVGELVFACPSYAYVLTVNERGAHCEHCFTRREDLFKCGKCKQAYYCNVDCQRGDWPMHKLECVAMCAYGEDWCPSETVRLVARILLKQVNCNGFTIEDEELSHLGSAVFPDVALMNHSCSPNVIVTYKGTVAEVRAVQEINPGDEIFNSYIDLLYPTEDRKERLLDSYFFTCQCTECTSKSKDKEKMEIRKLSSPPEPKEIRSMVRYAKNVIEDELLEMCELSQEKMGAIFADTNVYMLHMMYQAMGVCLYMQDWDGAMSYGEKIIQPYSVHYPAYSLNVASMYLKLGRLYLGLEKKTQGIRALEKAIAIMEVAHGKDHHYVAEVKREIEEQK